MISFIKSIKPFDVLVLLIVAVLVIKFTIQGFVDEQNFAYAFMTLIAGIVYAKVSQISNEN